MAINEVLELQRIRLDEDLSYRKLATEIGLPERTVFRILNTASPKIWDRTLHKIRQYLTRHAIGRRKAVSK